MDMIQTAEQLEIETTNLGLKPYAEAYRFQQECVEDVLNGAPMRLVFCEHPAILTLGRLADQGHLLFSEAEIRRRGVDLTHIDRGGEVTLHAPGQLVVYPIIDLKHFGRDLHEYMRKLEQVGIDLLSDFDIISRRNQGLTGVWAGSKKVISLGIGVRKWVAYHGMAINVSTDLSLFSLIKPCGLDVEMTSLKELSGHDIQLADVRSRFVRHFCREFHLKIRE